jgi:hypothetical protein
MWMPLATLVLAMVASTAPVLAQPFEHTQCFTVKDPAKDLAGVPRSYELSQLTGFDNGSPYATSGD